MKTYRLDCGRVAARALVFEKGAFIAWNIAGRAGTLEVPFPGIGALRAARKLLPYWYAIGLRDCDSGGRVTRWCPVFAWNYWHLMKVQRAWYGAGDGEVWSRMTPLAWFMWRWQLWRERRYSERVEDHEC